MGQAVAWPSDKAAYASLNGYAVALYDDVKEVILHRYNGNKAHCHQFCTDCKRPEESYMNWRDWLCDHFHLWRKDQMTVEELMVLDQFLTGVLEELGVWLRERKPESLNQAA